MLCLRVWHYRFGKGALHCVLGRPMSPLASLMWSKSAWDHVEIISMSGILLLLGHPTQYLRGASIMGGSCCQPITQRRRLTYR